MLTIVGKAIDNYIRTNFLLHVNTLIRIERSTETAQYYLVDALRDTLHAGIRDTLIRKGVGNNLAF